MSLCICFLYKIKNCNSANYYPSCVVLAAYWHMDRDRDYWLVGESVLTSWLQRGPYAVGNTSPRRELKQTSSTSVSKGSFPSFEVSLTYCLFVCSLVSFLLSLPHPLPFQSNIFTTLSLYSCTVFSCHLNESNNHY